MYTMGNIFASDEIPIGYGEEPFVDSIPDRTVVIKKDKQKRVIVRKGDGVPVIAQPPISGNTHEQPIRF